MQVEMFCFCEEKQLVISLLNDLFFLMEIKEKSLVQIL